VESYLTEVATLFETLFSRPIAVKRHRDAPLAVERVAYLTMLVNRGAAPSVVRRSAFVCRWIAEWIQKWPPDHLFGDEDIAMLAVSWARRETTNRRRRVPIPSPKESFRSVARGFLREAGRLAPAPIAPTSPHEDVIQAFLMEQRQTRGLAPDTCTFRGIQVRRLIAFLEDQGIALGNIHPVHLDAYLQNLATSWSRVSLCSAAVALRAWLHYCEEKGYVRRGLAQAVLAPRVYRHEGLPLGPTWEQISSAIAGTEGSNKPADLRARAVLFLLAVYGIRSGEVCHLRLEDIDWNQDTIRIVRSKSGRQNIYPLDATVGNAIARYLRHGRPSSSSSFLFLTLQAPFRPLSQGTLNSLVQYRFARVMPGEKGCSSNAIRHACARHLMDAGLTLKEVGDHLGHRCHEATRIYAKVNLKELRLVALEDLGGLA